MARTKNGNLTGRAAAEDLRDMRIYLSDQEDQLAAQRKDSFIQVRDELKALDPTGWEQWYDQFVPDWRGWINVQPAIDCIAKRVEELRALAPVVAAPKTSNNSQTLQWRVASASTLRNYATAVKDFESVTGTKADQARFITLRQWHDSMIGRKYAQNTIRARLSVVRLMSNNTSYPLPPKIKYPATLLSLKQVRAILAQAKNAGEREALMKALSGFNVVSKHVETDTDFMAHFLGIANNTPTSAQALTRLLKRCAKKAGIEQTVSLRIWAQSGAWLLKVLSPVEFSKLMPIAETSLQNAKPLHGIGRRSHLVKS